MPTLAHPPTAVTLLIATACVASPFAWLVDGASGMITLGAAAALVGCAGFVTHVATRLLCGPNPLPLLTMAVSMTARSVSVLVPMVLVYDMADGFPQSTVRLFCCCVVAFYMALLAKEILDANARLAATEPTVFASAPAAPKATN